MTINERILWAAGLVLLELMFFAVPVFEVLTVYILIARPAWFRDWVEKIYRD